MPTLITPRLKAKNYPINGRNYASHPDNTQKTSIDSNELNDKFEEAYINSAKQVKSTKTWNMAKIISLLGLTLLIQINIVIAASTIALSIFSILIIVALYFYNINIHNTISSLKKLLIIADPENKNHKKLIYPFINNIQTLTLAIFLMSIFLVLFFVYNRFSSTNRNYCSYYTNGQNL